MRNEYVIVQPNTFVRCCSKNSVVFTWFALKITITADIEARITIKEKSILPLGLRELFLETTVLLVKKSAVI